MSRKNHHRNKIVEKRKTGICTSSGDICIKKALECADNSYQPDENRQKEKNTMNTKKKELKARRAGKHGPNKRMPWRRSALKISMMAMTFIMMMATPVLAAESDPIAVVNNLSSFIFGLIRAVGIILLGWGIVQIGLSFQSHDPSQRSNGFLTLAGGLVITFAKEILNLILG